MLIFIVIVLLLFILDIAALRWGADSRDKLGVSELERHSYHDVNR